MSRDSKPEMGSSTEDSASEKELCRDFKKGDCRRGQRCIYYHPELQVCRDFQNRECSWRGCKYVHVTKSEKEIFDASGVLPPHITNGPFPPYPPGQIKRSGNEGSSGSILGKRSHDSRSSDPPARRPPPAFGSRDNGGGSLDGCRDFEKGDCRRGSRCKFYHPKLVICRDFQKGKCDRDSCRFLHMTQEEENTYDGNGIVPDHIDKDALRRNRIGSSGGGGDRGSGSGRGGRDDDSYGRRRGPDNGFPGPAAGAFNAAITLEAALQENAMLKLKQVEMQQQITDLRRMNDTLYEQNQTYRNKQIYS